MPLYRIQAPNGLTYQIEGPEGASQEDVAMAVLAQNPEAGKPFKEAGFSLADTGVSALQSAVGTAKSTLQGFGAEAPGVETLGSLQKGIGQLYSPERQAEMARRDALEKAAAKSGSTLEEIKTAGAGVTEAPIQATASAVGSSAPTVALSIGAAALAIPAAAALGLVGAPALAFAAAVGIGTKYALGALQGAGSVKGSIYDAVKEEVAKQYPDLSKEEVSKIALEAQNFTGKNWDNIMAGTGIGFVAGGTGIEKELLKKLSKPVAAAAAKKAGEEVAKKGVIAATGRGVMAGLKEAVPEGIQGGQEQFAANVAQTREGFETPAMEGVLGAATKEGMMGMLGGSAVHPFTGAPTTPTAQQVPGQPTDVEAAAQAAREARAQEQMGVKQGRAAREGEKILDTEAQAQADQQQAARVEAEKAAATELQTLRAQRQAELEQTFPKDYSDVMQKTDAYATLFQEKQALVNQTQTKEVKARIKTVDGLIQGIIEEDTRVPNEFKRMQAENAKVIKNLPPDLQAKYAATAFTVPEPQQMEIRAATVEQTPVQQTDLMGQPIQQEAPAPAAPEKFKTVQTAAEAQAALDLQNRRDARAGQAERNAAKDAGQLGLFTRVGTPTDEAAVPEPKIIVKKPPVTEPTVRQKPTPETVAPVITSETLGVLGIGPTAVMRKPGHAIQGLDITKPDDAAEVRNMLTIYKEGRSPAITQKVDAFLGRPEFQALPALAPSVPMASKAVKTEAPKVETSVAPKDAGYHAGDLGYAGDTTLGNMSGRSTGHFGTGVYFVGKPEAATNKFARDDRPVNTVDLSKYNLAKPRDESNAKNLHEGLKAVNSLVGQDLNDEATQTKLDQAAFNVWLSVGTKFEKDQVKAAITNAVQEATTARTDDVVFTDKYLDSASTRAMKALGFEGVDVRGIPDYDNTTYGTVVYAPSLAPAKPTKQPAVAPEIKQAAEKRAANKAAQPSAKKAKNEAAKPTAEPAPTPTVTKAVEAPPAPAPIKVVKKVEPKKVEPKKVEPKKLEAPKVEPKKEEPKVDKALEKARETADDLDLDPDTTKAKVKSFAKRLHKAGLIDDIGLNAVESISKDKDMGYEDALDEVKFALDDYERQQKKAPEAKPEAKAPAAEEKPKAKAVPEPQKEQIEKPFNRLTEDQKQELEEFYGDSRDTPAFWDKLRTDVVKSINEGSKAVAKAIRELVNQIASGVLAAGLIFNPTGLSNQYNINLPKTFQQTISITAPVPEAAKSKMSPLAQDVYGAMAPVAMKTGKWFMVADKPNGMLHIFKEDGSHALSDATLYGKDAGDVLDKVSSLEGGPKITPAGKFTMKESPADYAGKTSLILVESKDHTGYIAVHAADVSTPSERRLARLETPTAEDNRISYGCINTKHDTFIKEIKPHINELDGGLIFVLPDATETTAEMFKPETEVVERTETPATAKAEGARDIAKKEEKLAETQALQKPAADLSYVDRPVAVEADLQAKLQEGDVKGALQAILKAPKGVYNDLDRAVARRILLTNKLPSIELVAEGALGREGDNIVAGQYDALTDKIQLVNGYAGAHVLLHELVHGFVHRAIALQGAGKLNNAGIRNLQELYDYVAKTDPKIMKQYGMTNLSEFASEAMSNKAFQAALMAIPYRRTNALTQFAQSVLRALGLSTDSKHTALAAAMISVDSIMTEGRKLQIALTGTEVEGSLPGIAPVMVKELDDATRQAIKDIQAQFPVEDQAGVGGVVTEAYEGVKDARKKSGILTAFRQQAVDKYATVESKVSTLFSQGVRDYFGNINPMILTRQAEDSAKIVMDFFRAGGIRLTKDGLVESYKQGKSMVTALQKVGEYARANGLTYTEAKNEISTILEGHRLHNINEEHNKPLEASALIFEQQGKNKLADAERAKKITMHMDLKQIAALEDAYQKSAGVREIQDDLNATRTQAVDLMIATGRLTKEQGQFWKDNTAYVPFSRVFEEAAPNMVYRGKGLGVLRKLPNMEGSLGRPVKNVLDSYANRLSWMVEDSMKNHAAVKLLETMEAGGFAKEVPTKEKAGNPNLVVNLFRDGKPVLFEVQNEYDMLAFQQAPEMMNWFIKGLGATSRFLRLSITAMPPFAIKQVVEDAQRAAFYSGVERPLVVAMKTVYNLPRTFFGEVTGRKSPMVKRMEELGVVGDYDFNIYRPVSDIEKEIGVAKRNVGQKLFHRLEQFTKASDLSARLAVYEETMRDTKSAKHPDGDEVLAQTRARELINFSRRGSSSTMRTAARIIPFFNAYAQGMDVLYRSATGLDSSASINRAAARKLFLSRVAIMTAMGFVYALAMGDDEGYKNATEEVRDNNWLLPNGYKFGVPKELGFIFKSIPERVVDYYRRYGTDEEQSVMQALGSVAKGAMSAYGTPNVTPSYIKPFLEAATNHSFFLQRELESAAMKRLEPGKRYTSSTSELAKVLGEQINKSPIMIDNFIRGMFGMAGSTTLLITDAILNPTRPDRPLYQMPFTSLFLYNTEGGRAKNEFYDLQEKVSQANDTFKSLRETSPDKAVAYYEKNANLIAVAPILNSSLQQLSKSRKLRQQLETLTDEQLGMTSKERREAIDSVLKQENDSLKYVRMLDKQVRDLGK